MLAYISRWFTWTRFIAVMHKEFIQMLRDPLTFGMMLGIPLMQLILFGYAINTNPRHLPTAVVAASHSDFTRRFTQALENTKYFKITEQPKTIKQANDMLATGKVMFVVSIPPNFTRDLLRGQKPQILVEGDATYPGTINQALSALPVLQRTAFDILARGPLTSLRDKEPAFDLVTHVKYNPENITQFSVVPGLLGVILTMTMVMITSQSLTRERERGTIESLLATPVTPIEVMVGKILPYVMVGYIQLAIILLSAFYLFHIPIYGSVWLLIITALPFIGANLSVGLMFSSIAKNQLQSVQMAFFFFLPSILLSGFVFPFAGMPKWAQMIGSCLPLTYYVRIVRGLMLKGLTPMQVWPLVWPIVVFTITVLLIGVLRYQRTLD